VTEKASAERPRTRLAREQRRALLVDAATAVFDGRDPAGVTFEEIADAAGVSRALVYNYFGDRQGLIEAVARRASDRLSERVTAALATTRGLREALAAAIRVSLEFAHEDPAGYRYAVGSTAPLVPALYDEQLADMAQLFGEGEDALLVARGVLTSLQAMVLHCVDRGPEDIERATEVIVAFVAGGFVGIDAIGFHLRPTWPVPSEGAAGQASDAGQVLV
jgi:AcrR family transcriptional regulator